jgi:hypothetical protein
MSCVGEMANDAAAAAAPKITKPICSTPLRPNQSDRLPAASTNVANTKL